MNLMLVFAGLILLQVVLGLMVLMVAIRLFRGTKPGVSGRGWVPRMKTKPE